MKVVEEVMQYRRAEPFKPFVIELKDGRRFVVRAPHHVARDEAYTSLSVAADEDSVESFSGAVVASVKPYRSSGASGRRRRKK